eukprot:5499284-Amphidinium_carterae.1
MAADKKPKPRSARPPDNEPGRPHLSQNGYGDRPPNPQISKVSKECQNRVESTFFDIFRTILRLWGNLGVWRSVSGGGFRKSWSELQKIQPQTRLDQKEFRHCSTVAEYL